MAKEAISFWRRRNVLHFYHAFGFPISMENAILDRKDDTFSVINTNDEDRVAKH
jgi:hypothetical protein